MNETAYVLEKGHGDHCHELRSLRPVCLRTRDAVRQKVCGQTRAFWIAVSPESLFWLAEALAVSHAPRRGLLLALLEVPGPLHGLFADRFERVVERPASMLPLRELALVMDRDDRADFCIGGTVVKEANMVALIRGDLSALNVPLSDFVQRGAGPAPDVDRFEIADHGRTLRFGDYQAAVDSVLYEKDPAYRRRLKKLRLEEDRSLGGSLRRLRLQRGLRLADFGRWEKAVARIERGEVAAPRGKTLGSIARRLGVTPEQILEF